jgi:hypothetical protein
MSLCRVLRIMIAVNKAFMLSIIILNFFLLSVFNPSVVFAEFHKEAESHYAECISLC